MTGRENKLFPLILVFIVVFGGVIVACQRREIVQVDANQTPDSRDAPAAIATPSKPPESRNCAVNPNVTLYRLCGKSFVKDRIAGNMWFTAKSLKRFSAKDGGFVMIQVSQKGWPENIFIVRESEIIYLD